jgi:hypothetical protein
VHDAAVVALSELDAHSAVIIDDREDNELVLRRVHGALELR